MRRRSSVRTLLVAALLASIVPVANSIPPLSTSSAADGSVSGTVFDDKDMSGAMNGSEAGVQGVLVKAYDSAGTLVGSATTAANGTYTLAVTSAATTSLRIEFTTPDGYQSSFVGSGNATSIQFVTIGAANVNYGIQNPSAYCDNNSASVSIAAACIRPGTTTGTPSVESAISTIGWTSRTSGTLTSFSNTGAVWGLASDRLRGTLWASAVVRRHSSLGAKGLGGLYVFQTGNASGPVASFDLAAAPFNLTFAATPNDFSDSARGITSSSILSLDTPGYSGVGRAGIGDIDASPDGQFLYVTNLYTRQIHRFTLGGTSSSPTLGSLTTYSLPAGTCAGTTARPWALNTTAQTGRVLVGVVCTGEEASFSATTVSDGGVILNLDPAANSWTTEVSVSFNYTRGFERCKTAADLSGGSKCNPIKWHKWTDDFAAIRLARTGGSPVLEAVVDSTGGTSKDLFWFSQPMIVDIEKLADGSLVAGVSDRFNYQLGAANFAPDETNVGSPVYRYATGRVSGDLILLCKTASGYNQEGDGSCSGTTTYTAATRTSQVAGLASATPYREFFDDNLSGSSQGAHQEITIGGLAINPSSGTQLLAVSAMDANNVVNRNGVRWFNLTNGSMNGVGVDLTEGTSNSFEKSVSMGDLELICDAAPLQIGNRIWYDVNANGIQDPGESPVAGVTVELYAPHPLLPSLLILAGTAVTDANGTYYFSSTVTEPDIGNGDNVGGGLLPYKRFEIRVATYDEYDSGPINYRLWNWTQSDQLSSTSGLDDSIDSDPTLALEGGGQYYEATITGSPLAPGQINHTFDFGLKPTPANPLSTTTTTSTTTTSTTTSTTTTSTTTTSTTTTSTTPTTSSTSTSSTSSTVASATSSTSSTSTTVASSAAGTTTTTTTSSTTTSTTAVTTTTSSTPPAADGGVSVGNYVWIDLNKDGIQDAGEPGIAGVKLTLRDSMGRAVTDRAGKPVEPTYTDSSGYYYFSNLPVGRYEVFITYPKGYLPTKTGSGTTANDSSTDSALSKDLPTPGMKDYTLDFGVIPSAVIEEPIWVDTNGDGFLSSGERLVPGADVIILNEDGSPAKNLRGEFVTPVRSQADGSFAFKDLAPGKYKVVVVYPEGYTAGPSNASSVMFTTDAVIPPSAAAMSSGKVVATPKPSTARTVTPVVSIGNLVWFDLDKDGFQDPAERGVAGATLTAFKADGKTRALDVNGRLVGKLKTSKTGRFLFTNLPPGGYVVKIVYPSGYRATIAKSAGRAKNSSTNVSKSLVLAAGESDMTLDFGLVRMPVTRLPSTL